MRFRLAFLTSEEGSHRVHPQGALPPNPMEESHHWPALLIPEERGHPAGLLPYPRGRGYQTILPDLAELDARKGCQQAPSCNSCSSHWCAVLGDDHISMICQASCFHLEEKQEEPIIGCLLLHSGLSAPLVATARTTF